MPTYEMPLLLRIMAKPDLVATLKRAANVIFDKGGVIRKIDYLGLQETPYKMRTQDYGRQVKANYFVLHFDAPPRDIDEIKEDCQRDSDVVRARIFSKNEPELIECTLDEEMKPPPYRKDVQEMMTISQRLADSKNRKKFKWNTGLDHYPFCR